MNKTLLGALALTMAVATSADALAKNIDLTNEEVTRVGTVEQGLDKLRVKLSRKLVVERVTKGTDSVEVNGDIDVVYEDHILREEVGAEVRGKIVAIEGEEVTYDGDDTASLSGKTIYVSFDPSCTSKDCAFGFVRPFDDTTDYCSSYSYTCSYKRVFQSESYVLAKVPTNANFSQTTVFSKKGLMKRKMEIAHGVYAPAKGGFKYAVRLRVDEDELRRVVEESKKHPGWD